MADPLKPDQMRITLKIETNGTNFVHERLITMAKHPAFPDPIGTITNLIRSAIDFALGHVSWAKRD